MHYLYYISLNYYSVNSSSNSNSTCGEWPI